MTTNVSFKNMCARYLILSIILLLSGDIEKNPGPKCKKSYCIYNISDLKLILSRRSSKEQLAQRCKKNLFAELPLMGPEEYCRKCRKIVTQRHNAISCDLCSCWTHLNCSDMPKAAYKQHQREKQL